MWVVGTAGHVDHGKSTLVEALTGTHPDRLREEKVREMTIELGFAWFTLPGGEPVGIVDVPGHRDFIENMLAGVGGIDAVLFVIAADEGIMPQTREHLAILDLIQVKSGIIVLTKVDLAPDEEWLELVEHEIREFCEGTILEKAPLVRVSAVTGLGIEQLKTEIAKCLADTPEKKDLGKPRLAVDRVFTISGYGTVVTGTLVDGNFKIGDEVLVLPGHLQARIRGIQTYNQKVTEAYPGNRTAINLAGIDREDVKRGDVIVHPNDYQTTARLDAQIRLLKDADLTLKHNAEVKFFLGATEVEGRIRLLGESQLLSGAEGFIQLELEHPVVAVKGDRFILRRPSPPATVGGGMVLDPFPMRRYKLNDTQVLDRLEKLTAHPPEEDFLDGIDQMGMASADEIIQTARVGEAEAGRMIKAALERGDLISLSPGEFSRDSLLLTRTRLNRVSLMAEKVLADYHSSNPLKRGILREEFKTKLGLRPAEFPKLLQLWVNQKVVIQQGQWISLPGQDVTFTPVQQKKVLGLLERFEQNPFTPPGLAECIEAAGEGLVNSLIESGKLVKVSQDVLFTPQALSKMSDFIRERSASPQPFTVGEFRDRFQTSRKYSLAYLEYLDELKATRREGEGRLLIHPENLP